MTFVDYNTVIRDFVIDFTSLYFFAYVILFRRYRNTELFVTCSLFNIFILLIIMSIVRTNFNIAIGFGLFALLSLIQLRSAQFTKTEMAYMLGCVALAVINGAGIPDLTFVLLSNLAIIASAWIISAWSIEHSAKLIEVDNIRKMSLTLDHIDQTALQDRNIMRSNLVKLLGVDVASFEIDKIDYVREVIELKLVYELADQIPVESEANRFRQEAELTTPTDKGVAAMQLDAMISAAEVHAASNALVPLVGPIASVLAKRLAQKTIGHEDYYRRLAEAIPDAGQRTQFLAKMNELADEGPPYRFENADAPAQIEVQQPPAALPAKAA